MLQGEHSAILLTFIKLPFVIKMFISKMFEWPLYTGFIVILYLQFRFWNLKRKLMDLFHVLEHIISSEIYKCEVLIVTLPVTK